MTTEECARRELAAWWQSERHSYRVECLDPVFYRERDYSKSPPSSRLRVRWSRISAAVRDFFRWLAYRARRPFLPRNPYL